MADLLAELTDEEYECALYAGEERLKNGPVAISASYDARVHALVVELSTGCTLYVPVHLLQGLEGADKDALAQVSVTPAGTGIRFDALDADFLVDGLLGGVFGTARWMAGLLGARGGTARTEAKRNAARTNGQKGGRPRGTKAKRPEEGDLAPT